MVRDDLGEPVRELDLAHEGGLEDVDDAGLDQGLDHCRAHLLVVGPEQLHAAGVPHEDAAVLGQHDVTLAAALELERGERPSRRASEDLERAGAPPLVAAAVRAHA